MGGSKERYLRLLQCHCTVHSQNESAGGVARLGRRPIFQKSSISLLTSSKFWTRVNRTAWLLLNHSTLFSIAISSTFQDTIYPAYTMWPSISSLLRYRQPVLAKSLASPSHLLVKPAVLVSRHSFTTSMSLESNRNGDNPARTPLPDLSAEEYRKYNRLAFGMEGMV